MLARPTPLVDVSTLQAVVDSLRADIDMILEARVPESEAPFVEPTEDTVLASLFATSKIPPPPPREHAKRRRGRAEDEARALKKERQEMEAAKRASLADEEARQMRAVELAVGASSSRNMEIAGGTADSVVAAEDTTEGVQIIEGTKPTSLLIIGALPPRFASATTLVFQFLCIGTSSCLFVGDGVNGK